MNSLNFKTSSRLNSIPLRSENRVKNRRNRKEPKIDFILRLPKALSNQILSSSLTAPLKISLGTISLVCKDWNRFKSDKRFKFELINRFFPLIQTLESNSSLNRTLLNICQKHPTLNKLNLSHCHQLADGKLRVIAKMAQLEKLDLSYCRQITGIGLSQLARLKPLRSLNLSHCTQITDAELRGVAMLTQLHRLNLSHCEQITDIGLAAIEKLIQLIWLNLPYNEKITLEGVERLKRHINEACKFSKIPMELLYSIFNYIPLTQSHNIYSMISNVSLVCKTWQMASRCLYVKSMNADIPLKKFFYCHKNPVFDIKSLVDLQMMGQNLCSLNFKGCDFITDDDLSSLAQLKCLERLNLARCEEITEDAIEEIAQLSTLRSLNISCFDEKLSAQQIEEITRLTQLNSLTFTNPSEVKNSGIKVIARLQALRTLNITAYEEGCINGYSDSSLEAMAMLTQLEHLKLANCERMTSAGIRAIGMLAGLQSLTLESCISIRDAEISAIAQLTQLHTLHLINELQEITDDGLKEITQLTRLQSLTLVGIKSVLYPIFTLTQLKELDLSLCTKIRGPGFLEIVQLTKLQSLKLSQSSVSDDELKAIAKLAELRDLNLVDCHRITEEGILELATLTQLQMLDFSGCKEITFKAVQEFVSLNQEFLQGTSVVWHPFPFHSKRSLKAGPLGIPKGWDDAWREWNGSSNSWGRRR